MLDLRPTSHRFLVLFHFLQKYIDFDKFLAAMARERMWIVLFGREMTKLRRASYKLLRRKSNKYSSRCSGDQVLTDEYADLEHFRHLLDNTDRASASEVSNVSRGLAHVDLETERIGNARFV